jgi:hypothetical protein
MGKGERKRLFHHVHYEAHEFFIIYRPTSSSIKAVIYAANGAYLLPMLL